MTVLLTDKEFAEGVSMWLANVRKVNGPPDPNAVVPEYPQDDSEDDEEDDGDDYYWEPGMPDPGAEDDDEDDDEDDEDEPVAPVTKGEDMYDMGPLEEDWPKRTGDAKYESTLEGLKRVWGIK